jgi:beta-galactosidase
MYIGVDYYPEHWPEERWAYDADRMRDAGFNVVRLAEFAWQRFEPVEGRFEFEWLDKALATLKSRGISAILGTPTAVAPVWLDRKYPETAAENNQGRRLTWGVRKANCPTSPAYRLLSERITRAMAAHYASNPAVIGWQTDNEFDGPICYCHGCVVDFQDWLHKRHGSIEALNAAWGTHFWGHAYSAFAEIGAPENLDHYNPGLCLDWLRHHTWRTVRFQHEQVRVLRELCPNHFVTHNFMAFGNRDVNGFELARDLDFASVDVYPIWSDQSIPYEAAAAGDLTRGLKRKNYWVMESTAGPCGWGAFGRDPFPGEIRKVAFQQVAHGSDNHVWFRWRACTAGREQYWHGLLGHDGKPLRRYAEAGATARDLHKLASKLAGTTVRADVAIVFDYDSRWAVRIQPGYDGNDVQQALMRYHAAAFRAGVNVDIVSAQADLSAYKAVFAPDLHVLPDALATRLCAYVENGGVLVADCRTGVKTETNLCHDRTLPGLLSAALGIEIEEYGAHSLEYPVIGKERLPGSFTSIKYNDWITPKTAASLATYDHWHLGAYPAVTRNTYGKGAGYYVGTVANEDSFYDALIAAVFAEAGVAARISPPPGVEVSVREGDGKTIVFVLNHTDQPIEIPIADSYGDLLSDADVSGSIQLDRFGVAVLEERPTKRDGRA